MTAPKCEERGLGFFFGERDRQTRFEIRFCVSSFSLSLNFPSREVSNLPLTHHHHQSLSLFRKHVRHRPMRDFRRHENQFKATVCGEQSIVRDENRQVRNKREKEMRTSLHLIIPRFCDKSFSLFFGSLNCTENGGKTTSYYCCSLFSLERLPLTTTTTFFIIVIIVTPIRRILTRLFPLLCARVNRE